MNKALVKQDINFMENPLWFQDERLAMTCTDGYRWTDDDGYTYRAGYKPPVKIDQIFLLYLLLQSQRNEWTPEIKVSRYQVVKDCGLTLAKYWYERLEESLRRWKMIGVEFNGTFYDGKKYHAMNFGIIDSWLIEEETKDLHVIFSPLYIKKIKESTFFRYLNFNEVKALHSPLATRVYELVVKTFQGRSFWETDAFKFAQKIPMNEKYPADIIPKIKTAVNRINEKTSLKLKLHIRPAGRGKTFIGFEKLPADAPVEIQPPVAAGLPETDEFKRLVRMIPPPENTKKTLLEAVSRAYKKHGFEYAARNIRYTTKQATRNYRAYLDRALKEDLGKGWAEDQAALEQMATIRAAERKAAELKQQQEMEALRRDEEKARSVLSRFAALSQEEQDRIRQAALEAVKEPLKTHIREKRIGWERSLNFAIKSFLMTARAQEAEVS
jgi:hypothetical protein